MSIVDAIEKAKLLARQRQPESVREQPVARDHSAATGTHRAARSTEVPAAQVRHEPMRIDTVRLHDPEICSRNHILVPGADPRLTRTAAAPYRMMRALVLRRAKANNWSTLAITSPGAGEGKSTTAINLAISIAREGNYDVFLIDLDLRSPSVGRYLGVTPSVDLVNYFEGKAAVQDVFFTVGIERLVVAGSVVASDHSSELLANGRLEELLAFIRRISPKAFVIFDLPPVGVTDDALVVAPKVDATVLIASQGRTRRDGLRRAIALLSEHSLAGVILNRSNEPQGTDYYGEYRK